MVVKLKLYTVKIEVADVSDVGPSLKYRERSSKRVLLYMKVKQKKPIKVRLVRKREKRNKRAKE